MTAQIVLGNGHSIVVASDGASTMGGRTYGSAEKIVPLPNPHRLAVLHSGSVQLHGVSVPALLENWATSLSPEPLESVKAYSDSFRKYLLKEIPNFSSATSQLMDYMDAIYFDLRRIRDRITSKAASNEPTLEVVATSWDEVTGEMLSGSAPYNNDPWVESTYRMLRGTGPENTLLTDAKAGNVYRKLNEWECSLDGIIAQLFGSFPSSPDIAQKAEMYIKSLMLYYYPNPWDNNHNLNFVGYGKDEVLPSYHNSRIFGMVSNRFFTVDVEGYMAYRVGGGHFVINTIGMSGDIDRFLRDMGFNITAPNDSLNDALSYLLEHEKDLPLSQLKERILAEFDEAFTAKRIENFGRIRLTLANLNPINLARVAEGLIRMQALAMDASGDLPSVGSGVVVGVITRADGFVWQERLNSHLR